MINMKNKMFDGKKILITGGTGSLGRALTEKLLETNVDTIRIFSREEFKQVKMQSELPDERLRFLIGDVRDKERISRALEDINIVIHAAALKQIHVAEYNPFEAVKTNVYGSQNIIETCLDKNVELVLGVGTDKAVSPFNTYGATKFLMERLFLSANHIKGSRDIKFGCVRYGNVLGSRGSILPIIINQIKSKKKITITDPTMTRFTITMNQALDFIFRAIENLKSGEVFVPKLKAYKLEDMKDALIDLYNYEGSIEKIKVRPGEKFHESLISKNEIRITYENEQDYVLLDQNSQLGVPTGLEGLRKTSLTEEYSSDKVELYSKEELKEIIKREKFVSEEN